MASDLKLLFWYEENTKGHIYTWMDRCASYFGVEPIVVDCLGQFDPNSKAPHVVGSLDEALNRFVDHTWVFLDSHGGVILDGFAHPVGPAVYAIGSNITGFGRAVSDLPGAIVRLRNPDEIWDYQVAQMVLYDRMIYQLGRRM